MKAIIVDDEPLAQQIIEKYIDQIESIEVVSVCNNALEAFQALRTLKVDLMFMDINMPQMSGLNLLKTLKDPPLVIVTTAYTEYAIECYEFDVIDYLKKPFSFERFMKAIAKAEFNYELRRKAESSNVFENGSDDFFFVKCNKKTVRINFADIVYVEALGDYVKIFTKNEHFVTNLTMKKLIATLPADDFIRIHKSFIIAMKSITAIEGNMVYLDVHKLPIGSSYRRDFFKLLQPYTNC